MNEDKEYEEFDDEDEDDFEDEDEDYLERDMYQDIDSLVYVDVNAMKLAMRILEKSWFWSFYSTQTKLRYLKSTYQKMKELLED